MELLITTNKQTEENSLENKIPSITKPLKPVLPKFSQNALVIIDALNALNKSMIYVNNPEKYGYMDELTKQEKVVNFIDISSVSSYVEYMRQSEGRSFVELIDTTLEFSVYIERTCTKFINSNAFTVHNPERAPAPYAQHIMLDILKLPDYRHTDKRTIDMEYRHEFSKHAFKHAISAGLKKRGIIYIAEFNVDIIIDKIKTLLSDDWKWEC